MRGVHVARPGTLSGFPDAAPRQAPGFPAPDGWQAGCNGKRVTARRSSGPPKRPRAVQEVAMTRRTATLVGAAIGLALFLALGLLPSLVYGGYAGVMLASAFAGAPVNANFAVRAVIVAGMVFGVLGVGALFTAGGAVAGAVVGTLTGAPARKPATKGNARA